MPTGGSDGPGRGGPSRAREIAHGVGLSVAVLVVCLVALELVVRYTHAFGARVSWSEPDPLITYRYTPGRVYWHNQENDHPISGTINRFGLRDRDRTLEKPPGTYRIAVLGDSFVEALQVEQDSTFLSLAEDRLNRQLPVRVELMNFGRSGMSQAEEHLVLQHDVMGFAPDMVAVVFIPRNDIEDLDPGASASAMRPFYQLGPDGTLNLDTSFAESRRYRVRVLLNPLKQHSALVSLLAERHNALQLARRQVGHAADAHGSPAIPGYLTLCTDSPDPMYSANYRLSKAILSAMAEYCAGRGVRFLLVCGDYAPDPSEAALYEQLDRSFDVAFLERDLGAFADSLGIDYLGLQEPFRRAILAGDGPLHWAHWNYAGHRVAAEEVEALLRGILASESDH